MTAEQKIEIVLDMISSFYSAGNITDGRVLGWLDAIFEVLSYETE